MGERPKGLGKVAENGTLNENGAFYSVQDINVLLEEKGGGGGDLPTPTVADAGSVVVVDEQGKYALGEAGGSGGIVLYHLQTEGGTPSDPANHLLDSNGNVVTYNDIAEKYTLGKIQFFFLEGEHTEDEITYTFHQSSPLCEFLFSEGNGFSVIFQGTAEHVFIANEATAPLRYQQTGG